MKKVLLVLFVLAVYALHQDYWNWRTVQPLGLGFLPVGLWYHALYACLCAFTMWLLGETVWPKHLEEVEAQVLKNPDSGRGGH